LKPSLRVDPEKDPDYRSGGSTRVDPIQRKNKNDYYRSFKTQLRVNKGHELIMSSQLNLYLKKKTKESKQPRFDLGFWPSQVGLIVHIFFLKSGPIKSLGQPVKPV
jgi:hypothetical protein